MLWSVGVCVECIEYLYNNNVFIVYKIREVINYG